MESKTTFKITIDSQLMIVHYKPNYLFRYMAHFEFRSPYNPPKQIPVSETGYLSYFAYMEELKDILDMETYIYDLASALMQQQTIDNKPSKEKDEQMSLF